MESLPLAKSAIMDCQITEVLSVSRDINEHGTTLQSFLSELANGRLKIENRTNESWFFAVKSKKEKKFFSLFERINGVQIIRLH